MCQHLGVGRETALEGMRTFHRDPYALSLHRLGDGILVNGLSVNDIQSTCMVWEQVRGRLERVDRLVILVNNRPDRGSRSQDMRRVCLELQPDEVWLLGAVQGYMRRGLERRLPAVRSFRGAAELPLDSLRPGETVFAIGNIAGPGRELMARVREEGTPYVQ